MATVSPAAAPSGVPAAAPVVEAGQRGATRIADRVVAKIAAQAAREALREVSGGSTDAHATVTVRRRDGKGGGGQGGRGRSGGGQGNGGQVLGEARVRVAVELDYPSDIGAQCGAVRRRVAARVTELAAMTVPEVAVTVERLRSEHLERADRGRVR